MKRLIQGPVPVAPPRATKPARLLGLDVFRGAIIVLMALDHANYFVAQQHPPGEHWAGPFPTYESALPFLTRWVTHLAAPGFFLLLGVGVALFTRSRLAQGWRRRAVIGHFAARGTLLIALQFLVVNRAWQLSPGGWDVQRYLGVIAALGATMILAGLLVWLSPRPLILLSILLLIGTEWAVPDPGRWGPTLPLGLRLTVASGGDASLWSNYPPLAWLELVTLGLALGHSIARDPRRTYRRMWHLGALLLVLFLRLRLLDGFGNLRPRAGDGWIDLLNVVKYPPSITFTLLTTGINLILLGSIGRLATRPRAWLAPLAILGRTPLFFYVAHLFLYAALGRWLTPGGTSIPAMIPYWLLGLLLLLPLCAAYGRLKDSRPTTSLLHFL